MVQLALEIAKTMEAVSSSETSVNIYQITRRNVPEDSHFINMEYITLHISAKYA
jgi:hypothetical protein